MANIQRLVKNTSKYDKEVFKVFRSIADKNDTTFDRLSASTTIPNQVFASYFNDYGSFGKLVFLESAYSELENIREIDHLCTANRASKNKKTYPIRFVCHGYRDLDGDIIITNVNCPIIEKAYEKKFNTKQKFIDFIASESNSLDYSYEANARMFDFLKDKVFAQQKDMGAIGTDIVSIMGYTKHDSPTDSNNSFKLSEIAEAVIPANVEVRADSIMSGVLAITPKTINSAALYDKRGLNNINNYLENGSLECALISYEKNPNSNSVTPTTINDVKLAVGIKDEKQHNIKISSSNQPIENLYIAKQQYTNEM